MNFDLAPITSSEDEIPPVTDGEDPGDSESGSSPGDSSDSDDKVNILEKFFLLLQISFSVLLILFQLLLLSYLMGLLLLLLH